MQFELLIKLVAAGWLAYLFANYHVPFIDVIQEWVVARAFGTRLNRLALLLECPKCVGFWLGLLFVLAPISLPISLALIASLFASLFNRYAS